jgi:hypothetical protein
MVDPNAEAMAKGLEVAREKGLEDKLFAVVFASHATTSTASGVLVVVHPPAKDC